MAPLSLTQAARNFFALLERVRSGAHPDQYVSAARFRELLASAPPVDDAFVADLRAIRVAAGAPEVVGRARPLLP